MKGKYFEIRGVPLYCFWRICYNEFSALDSILDCVATGFKPEDVFQSALHPAGPESTGNSLKVFFTREGATEGQVISVKTGVELRRNLLSIKSVNIGAVNRTIKPPPDRGGWVKLSSAWVPVRLGRAWHVGSPA